MTLKAEPGTTEEQIAQLRQRIEQCLDEALPGDSRLTAAMRYAVLGGGKRLRPLLVHAGGRISGAVPGALDAPASAVEMIHAYSLVHDDLPAMDDDVLRRGRPTCHLAFDEATAILAGDALQARAFGLLANGYRGNARRTGEKIALLAEAAGPAGMAGGQALDLSLTGGTADIETLERLHRMKTGALIEASLLLGLLSADTVAMQTHQDCRQIGSCLGLAFQIQDDVLDATGETGALGKQPGADAARDQPTFVSVLGVDKARDRAAGLYDEAEDICRRLEGDTSLLLGLVRNLRHRRS